MNESDTSTTLSPADAAIEAYLLDAPRVGPHPVVVIEGGYFDVRYPESPDRLSHLRDSFAVMDQVDRLSPSARPVVLLAALINDFGADRKCGISAADCAPPLQEKAEGRITFDQLPSPARRLYAEHSRPSGYESAPAVHLFAMTTTRNRAARFLRENLRKGAGVDTLLFAAPSGTANQETVTAYARGEGVRVGSRVVSTGKIAVRCAGLMAQHYFDLFLMARANVEAMTSFWIFDFNRYTERERVRRGAEVSFACHPWPKEIVANVVNCIYFPLNFDGEPIQVTSNGE